MPDYVGKLKIGELGRRQVEIQNSVTSLSVDLSAGSISELTFKVHDPSFKMHHLNYFMIGRTVEWDDMVWEIAAVSLDHQSRDSVRVTARTKAMQRMRRDRGNINLGYISPSDVAEIMASRFDLKIFKEEAPVDGTITRNEKDDEVESSYDLMVRLARDLKWRFFECRGILYFASEKYLIENQPNFGISIPSGKTDSFYANRVNLRRSADSKKSGATFTTNLIKNESSVTIVPGMSVRFYDGREDIVDLMFLLKDESSGLYDSAVPQSARDFFNLYDRKFFVDKVSYDATGSGTVAVSGRTPEDSPDIACSLQVFQLGDEGDCVKRIQQAVSSGYTYQVTEKVAKGVVIGNQRVELTGGSSGPFLPDVEVIYHTESRNVNLKVTGVFDKRTEEAVKVFQETQGLPVTGIVDLFTWEKIESL